MTYLKLFVRGVAIATAAGALSASLPAAAAGNIIPGNWTSISWNGADGVLRAGSPWGPGSTPSNASFAVDGAFQPANTQWNNGSFWWDSTINNPVNAMTINLVQTMRFDQFMVQADDNDSYLLEWWDGAAWQNAWSIATMPSFGLVTRDSGMLGTPIYTNRLRFSATGGDGYYAVSEVQGFGAVPEPATWAMLIAGFGMIGAGMRRRSVAATA